MFNNIPTVTKNLLIINFLMFAATYVLGMRGVDLENLFGLHYFMAPNFHPYQFFTYMFMHGSLTHILFNMFALWMFGRIIEQVFGPSRFLLYYMVCGLGAGLIQEIVQYIEFGGYEVVTEALGVGGDVVHGKFLVMDGRAVSMDVFRTVGASGSVYGILLAFGMTFPNERMFVIPFPFPIRAKYLIFGYALLELLLGMSGSRDGVAHMAHIGGMLFGLMLILYWRNNGRGRNRQNDVFQSIRKYFSSKSKPRMKVTRGEPLKHGEDMEYNAKKRANEAEIDRILEKVKRHGYGCLTEEEKKRLFDASGK